MTGDGLVAFNQASGLQGTQLVPDLAVSLPTPTDGGRTYTFRLRPNIRYSNGRPLKASDVRSTLERDFKVGIQVPYYDGIVGAARCAKNAKRCDLSHGIVDGRPREDGHLPSRRPRPGVPVQASAALCLRRARGDAAARRRDASAAGNRAVRDCELSPEARRSGSVRNPHFHEWSKRRSRTVIRTRSSSRSAARRTRRSNDVIRGKADAFSTSHIGNVSFRGSAGCDRDPACEPGAHEPAADDGRALPQHPSRALRPSRRAQGAELRRGSRRGGRRRRRTRRRPGDVPDPAPQLPGLPALLPLHRRPDDARQLDGAGSREGARPHRPLRHARHEDHRLVLGGSGRPRPLRGEASPVAWLSSVDEGPSAATATSR